MNFINILSHQSDRASTSVSRTVTIGANKDGWVMAHECGGHCAFLGDAYDKGTDKPYDGYENDIMGAYGKPVTEQTIDDLVAIHEGNSRKRKGSGKQPPRQSGGGSGCASPTPGWKCGSDFEIWN
jgi:hypothetical protein